MPPPSVLPSSSTRTPRMSRSSSNSSAFSETIKFETKRLSGPNCWACNTCSPHICHVVAQEDIQAELWEQAGLFNFSYKSVENSIPLCPSCHAEFDRFIDPGYVFFPTDISYFIEFELRDRERRRQAAETGSPVQRQVPTASDYKTFQQQNGIISSDTVGGLYRRVFLRNYLLGGLLPDLPRSFATSKFWHGNPMASLRRAMAALGSSRFYVVDARIRQQLTQLFDLYFGDESDTPIDKHLRDIYKVDVQPASKRPRDEEDDSAGDQHKRLKGQTILAGMKTGGPTGSGTKFQAREEQFILGPSMTTSEIIQRYASVLAASSSALDE
ncbi:hypothetical protein I7I48_06767 [Histoplasma ohiense]|nr:hypothetical protein I7I48_06767 [Histoplasma ohiense (nom. inval.)]